MNGKKVLAVDDSPIELRHLSMFLQQKGYRVVTAVDGEEALSKAITERPELMVLDIILPKKNGYQVCRQLKTGPDTHDIKIILISSKSQESDRFWGLQQGADEYIIKPWDETELLRTVQRLS
jgi:twitching motility two-component system response regulator PilH